MTTILVGLVCFILGAMVGIVAVLYIAGTTKGDT